jgi:hypothetical protein
MRLVALLTVVSLALPGCTLVGAGVGAGGAALTNLPIPASSPEDKTSVGTAALVGAGVGLLIDLLILKELSDWSGKWNDH